VGEPVANWDNDVYAKVTVVSCGSLELQFAATGGYGGSRLVGHWAAVGGPSHHDREGV